MAQIEAVYDLDLVNQFHEPSTAVVTAAVVRRPDRARVGRPASCRTSTTRPLEPVDEAIREVIWPGYRTAIERVRDDLSDPERAPWFELTFGGDRRPR